MGVIIAGKTWQFIANKGFDAFGNFQGGYDAGNPAPENGYEAFTSLLNLAGQIAPTLGLPGAALGIGLNGAAAVNNTAATIQKFNNGTLQPSDVLQIAGSILGGLAAAAVVTGGVVPLGVAATIGAIGLAGGPFAKDAINQAIQAFNNRLLAEGHGNPSGVRMPFSWPTDNNAAHDLISRFPLDGPYLSGPNKPINDSNDLFDPLNPVNSSLPGGLLSYWISYYGDPLALDLDGGGIDTVAENGSSGALFDFDGQGIRVATGWINSGDGLLVRDINGNGVIDNGSELFGDTTALSDGKIATNGFNALAGMDSNNDGKVDSQDINFNTLRVWRDLDQDGVTDSGELFTLAQVGISSLNTGITGNPNTVLAGGVQAATGTFIRTDGSTGNMADINLKSNDFDSDYTTDIIVPPELQSLPNLTGMGRLRDLQQAATLSPALATALASYNAAGTRLEQKALLSIIVLEWAKTDPKYGSEVLNISSNDGLGVLNPNSTNIIWARRGTIFHTAVETSQPAGAVEAEIVHIVDAFKGGAITTTLFTSAGGAPSTATQGFVDNYHAIEASIYKSLLGQTRLKKYFDAVTLDIDQNGIRLNYSMVNQMFDNLYATNKGAAIGDLADLMMTIGAQALQVGWSDSFSKLRAWIDAANNDISLQPLLLDLGINIDGSAMFGTADSDTIFTSKNGNPVHASAGDDLVYGSAGIDNLYGNAGNDTLIGGAGNDWLIGSLGNDNLDGGSGDDFLLGGEDDDNLKGGEGNDRLDGGAGNNTLDGGVGNDTILFSRYANNSIVGGDGDDIIQVDATVYNDAAYHNTITGGKGNDTIIGGGSSDTYLFGRGDGQDTINDSAGQGSIGVGIDRLVFGAGITAADLTAIQQGTSLIVKVDNPDLAGATDQITIQNFESSGIEQFVLADGTVVALSEMFARKFAGTDGNDAIVGRPGINASINGGAGNDTITGGASDTILGGAGDDVIRGSQYGMSTLRGGDGNDTITYSRETSSLAEGGDGNDTITVDDANWNNGAYHNTIIGGLGNDTLIGGRASDTYVFNRGDGQDIIRDNAGGLGSVGVDADKLVFGAGITAADLKATIQGTSLVIRIDDPNSSASTDQITIENFESSGIEQIVLADGSILLQQDTLGWLNATTAGNDIIFGGSAGAILSGAGGDDIIRGGGGNDTFDGGAGNDRLYGGSELSGNTGSNTYLFGRGDGQDFLQVYDRSNIIPKDIVQLKTGITADDIVLSHVTVDGVDSLSIAIKGTNDRMVVNAFFDPTYGANCQIAKIRFDDGTILTTNQIHELTNDAWMPNFFIGTGGNDVLNGNSSRNTLSGMDGDDQISGNGGGDSIDGGAGNDTIVGGAGSDTIDGGAGNDVISDQGAGSNLLRGGDGNDTVNFSYNIAANGPDGNTVEGGAGDDLLQMINYETNDLYDTGFFPANTIVGGTGNDRMVSGNSSDTYRFNRGDGQDSIFDFDYHGRNRTDQIVFGEGITINDLTASRSGNNLVIRIVDINNPAAADQITVENWFGDVRNQLELFVFSNGTSLNTAQITQMGNAVYGGNGDDALNSGADNNVVFGLGGNDTIVDSGGSDTIDGGAGDDVITDQDEGSNLLRGGDGNDTINFSYGSGSNNTVEGGAGNDLLQMIAYDSAALQQGSYPFNTIVGGTGNDRMISGGSGDTYQFNRGDGQDSILDFDYLSRGRMDQIAFGVGIAIGDLAISRSGNNLLIKINDANNALATDQITVEDWFADSRNQLETFTFVNGTSLSNAQITQMGNAVNGSNGADILSGGSTNNNAIFGFDGNDTISDGGGNDTIDGGAGNDIITDSDGSDTIYGGAGDDIITDQGTGTNLLRGDDGNDIINFGYSIAPNAPVTNTIEGGAGDDLLQMSNYETNDFSNSGFYPANTISGGAGNDRMISGNSADTYRFNRGDGQDSILDFDYHSRNMTDQIAFGVSIAVSDLIVSHSGNNLVIEINDPKNPGATDEITVENWFLDTRYRIETFLFANGTSLSGAQITEMGNVIYGTNGADTINTGSDANTILGLGGNDTITDAGGNDTIDGGAGDDIITDQGLGSNLLRGGTGNDTINFSYGSGSNNTVEGGAGDDVLQMIAYDSAVLQQGFYPSNTIVGGTGNDRMISGGSGDTYQFNRGDGQDSILDFDYQSRGRTDVISFGAGIAVGDLSMSRSGNSLIVTISDPNNAAANDKITVENWYGDSRNQLEFFVFANGESLSSAQITDMGNVYYGTNDDETLVGGPGSNTIFGMGGNDTIAGGGGNDKLDGGAGDDTIIYSMAGNSTVDGGTGNDYIQVSDTQNNSAAYSNTIRGGAGNDRMVGGSSSDTYLFDRGDGQDAIYDLDYNNKGGIDRLVFGVGIVLADLVVSKNGQDLVIRITDPNNADATDQVTIEKWFIGDYTQVFRQLEAMVFADGTTLTTAQIEALSLTVRGTDGDDVLNGTNGDNKIVGLAGDDTINDNGGSDTIDGGDGNDTIVDTGTGTNILRGGAGDDTIVYSVVGNSTVEGGSGNDYIQVSDTQNNLAAYSNTIRGGAGNDRMVGGSSSDTYLFDRGDGQDAIYDLDYNNKGGIDRLVFGVGIVLADLVVSKNGQDLVIRITDPNNADATDQVTIEKWFIGDYTQVFRQLEAMVFADGTTLTTAQIEALSLTVRGTDGDDVLNGTNGDNKIVGLAGDDTINDNGGSDTIDGGDGNDTIVDTGTGTNILRGGAGDDTIVYSVVGNSTVEGGSGNDYIQVSDTQNNLAAYSNTIRGGAGNDRMVGGSSSDTYLFDRGDGQDAIYDLDYNNKGGIDRLVFGAGIVLDDLIVSKNGQDLVIRITDPNNADATDQVTIEKWFVGDNTQDFRHLEAMVFADGTTLTTAQIEALSLTVRGTDGDDVLNGTSGNNKIVGLGGNDTIAGGGGNDTLDGGAGDDTIIYSMAGNSTVDGGTGNDYIQVSDTQNNSAAYSNTIRGGAGNDHMVSGSSSDTYLFDRGDGQDTIYDLDYNNKGGIDRLVFGVGIVLADLIVSKNGQDLVIRITDPNNADATDQVTIEKWFIGDYTQVFRQLEAMVFADGTTLTTAQIEALSLMVRGTDGDDVLNGTNGDNKIVGLGGNDMIVGGSGNDTFDGGAGNDHIVGGSDAGNTGVNTYLFGRGDGQDYVQVFDRVNATPKDIIQFKAGVNPGDVKLSRIMADGYNGWSLLISIVGTTDQMIVNAFFDSTYGSRCQLAQIRFDDGTVWDLAQLQAMSLDILAMPLSIQGTEAGDTLIGSIDNNIINGLGGNDNISDAGGNNTLNGGAGNDTIYNVGAGNNLLIGGEGDDQLYGGSGNDTIDGGAGNDHVVGGSDAGNTGVNTYLFGRGDGQDYVQVFDRINATPKDIIQFKAGVNPGDVVLSRVLADGYNGWSLLISIVGTTDQMIVNAFFDSTFGSRCQLAQIRFDDGTIWDLAQLQATPLSIQGTDGGDTLVGSIENNIINGLGGNDNITDVGGNDTLNGGDGDDTITDQGSGDNILRGGAGNDTITYSNMANNTIEGGAGDDLFTSSDFFSGSSSVTNILRGGLGNDQFLSSRANDIYLFDRGDGQDAINGFDYGNTGSVDKIVFGAGITLNDLTIVKNGIDIVIKIGDAANASASDQITLQNWFWGDYSVGNRQLGNIVFADGSVLTTAQIETLALTVRATEASDTLIGNSGNDVIQGLGGADTLTGLAGNDLINGGSGDDMLDGGIDNDILIGGVGNDTIATGSGFDLIAFNRGDGQDTVLASTGTDNTLSLGAGIAYADLRLTQNGNDLVLTTGSGEQVAFKDWYASTANHSVANLQMVIEGGADYDSSSASAIHNKKIVQFDFGAMVAAFDQAHVANPALTSWSASSSMLDFYLASSDTAAIGGDLAYQYARNGNLAGISVAPAQLILNNAGFGTAAQSLQASGALQDASPRLM